jgi:lipopolysaccharide transport protein LptA
MGRTKILCARAILQACAGCTLLGLALTVAAMAAPKAAAPAQPEISWDAASVDGDFKTQKMHLKDVVITYGTMTVRADEADATGTDFQNSHWTFTGNVRINAEPRGNLRSDQAVVEFRDNQLVKATATGKPAEFDQKRADTGQITHGHADEIVYEVIDGTVHLSKDAYLSDGHSEITSPVLVYNLREEHIEATTSPGTGQRVHMTIAPRDATSNKPAASDPSKPQAPAPEANKPQQPTPEPVPPPHP